MIVLTEEKNFIPQCKILMEANNVTFLEVTSKSRIIVQWLSHYRTTSFELKECWNVLILNGIFINFDSKILHEVVFKWLCLTVPRPFN